LKVDVFLDCFSLLAIPVDARLLLLTRPDRATEGSARSVVHSLHRKQDSCLIPNLKPRRPEVGVRVVSMEGALKIIFFFCAVSILVSFAGFTYTMVAGGCVLYPEFEPHGWSGCKIAPIATARVKNRVEPERLRSDCCSEVASFPAQDLATRSVSRCEVYRGGGISVWFDL